MDAELETETPIATDAESAMRGLITPPEETPIETPEGDTPPVDAKPPEGDKPPGEATPPVDEPEAPASEVSEDNFDAEVDAIELKPGASKKSQDALSVLKQRAKDEHRAAVEATKKATELEAAKSQVDSRITELESKVLTPEVEQELTNLRQFRDTYGLEDDPAISKPFEEKITQASASLTKTLEQIGVPPATIKYINDNGGLYNFRLSSNVMPPQMKNADGSRMTQSQFYKRFIENNLNEGQKEELTDAYSEIRKAHRAKQQAVDNLKTNRGEFLKKREESFKAAQDDWVQRVTTRAGETLKTYGEVATLKQIPANATPEQKSAIEKHNANYKKAEARAHEILQNVTPENLTDAAIAAGYVDILKEGNADLGNKLAEMTKARDDLQKKYDDLREAGKTSDLRGAAELASAAATKGAKNAEDAMTTLVSQGQD